MERKRIAQIVILVSGLALFLLLGRELPKDQTVHYVLGDGSARVQEMRVRYAHRDEDWEREADFEWKPGAAPRIVTHEPRLADGDYTIEIDLVANAERNTVKRHVTLQGGGVTSIELAQAVPR
jgi:hypothetical protein